MNGPLPRVLADEVRLGEVYTNLIGNALKYNERVPRRVELGALADADETVLYVRDNAIGIPAERQDAVFRLFKHLHGRDALGGGTGVGLTLVRRIIERHGGRIWLESSAEEGTTFYFTLRPGREGGRGEAPQADDR